jgi:serine/threonine-protein kinase
MGEVYRATDSKLGRDVALKVLPEEFARDAQRMARFQREAQLLASLNHPNIATIHGLEEGRGLEEGTGETPAFRARALVMELVEGPTLAERIAAGPLPLDEALPIARQIAEALEYAHERGIIHRDLKPANIKLTPSGAVKVLDFGLAKALTDDAPQPDLSSSPTLSAAATKAGLILGTAAYMSPEQARGKAVDRRADIWAFGCVLYEMLMGARPFAGDTATETLAAVLRAEPDWTALPAGTPAALQRLLRRTLQKDAHLRLHSIADARLELQEAAAPQESGAAPGASMAAAPLQRILPWVLVAVLLFALFVVVLRGYRAVKAPLVTRFTFGENVSLLFARSLAVSPDGKLLAYIQESGGQTEVSIRALDKLESTPLRGAALSREPFFSPDGRWLGFVSTDLTIRKYSFADGTISLICTCGANSASWGEGDRIIFSEVGSISEVPAAGGPPRQLLTVDPAKGETAFYGPAVLPGGRTVLFTRLSRVGTQNPLSKSVIEALTLDTQERRVILENASSPVYSATGHLLFHRDGAMLAAPFDLVRLEVTGSAVRVFDQVAAGGDGSVKMSLSSTGVLAYATFPAYQLVWVDRNGQVTSLRDTPGVYADSRLSPDGMRLAVSESGAVWVLDLLRQTYTLLTFSAFDRPFPVWTMDGSRIAYLSGKDIYWKRADGGGDEELLLKDPPGRKIPTSISPDGRELAMLILTPGATGSDIFVLPLQGERKARPFLQSDAYEGGGQFSPSGKMMAYVSYVSGKRQVYVTPYPGAGARWQVSTEGGTQPRWNPAGGELFYRDGDRMMVVTIAESPRFTASKPRVLFEGNYSYGSSTTIPNYSVAGDGKRFVMIRPVPGQEARIHVVVNWFEELRRAMNEGAK